MIRAEKYGLGIATAGHVLLFGLLSAGFLNTPNPLKLNSPPMDVSLVDEVALQSMAPRVSTDPPPPSVAPERGPTQDAAPAPEPKPEPAVVPPPPIAKPVAKPAPPKPLPPKRDVAKAKPRPPAPAKPAPATKAKAAPEKPRAATTAKPQAAKPKATAPAKAAGQRKADRPRGSLLGNDFLKGIETEAPVRTPRPTAPQAAAMGPAQKSALDSEIRRQLKPHWKAPTGADADLLRTELSVQLAKDGSVIGTPRVIRQTGVTPSNAAQAKLHAEQAIRAVRLASPFQLPPQFYTAWQTLEPLGFDRRLSQ